MKIEVVSVCVNYSDYLKVSLPINKKIVDRIVIVTSPNDIETQKVCKENNVECVVTKEFYKYGPTFKKFKGINEGLKVLDKDGWILFLDSDIVLDPLASRVFSELKLDTSCLYGCDRVDCIGIEGWEYRKPMVYGNWLLTSAGMQLGSRICQYYGQQGDNGKFAGWKPLGFFQLVHNSTLTDYPSDCEGADHCDIVFTNRYSREKRVFIPEIIVTHLESVGATWGENWGGRTSLPFDSKIRNPIKIIFYKIYRRLIILLSKIFTCLYSYS